MTSVTEIERKYDVDRQLRVPDLVQIPGIAALEFPGTVTLTAIYFDTEALNLGQNRIILRRREGGSDSGWHIKLPAREGRTELRWPLDADPLDADPLGSAPGSPAERDDHSGHGAATVPGRVLDPIRTIVRDRPLTPLARITTIRTTVLLLNDQGDAVAELADDDVSASDMRGGVFRKWREWEVELFSAAPNTRKERTALLDAIEAVLLEAGAQPSTSIAKIARALGADALGEPTKATSHHTKRVEPHGGSAASVVATLRDLGAELIDLDPKVRADEPQAVHAMRTTVRRLRSVLSIYRRLFDRVIVDRLRDDLETVGVALGTARDADVRGRRARKDLDGLDEVLRDDAARARLSSETQVQYVAAHHELRRVLSSRQYFGLLDRLDDFLAAVTPETCENAAREVTKALGRGVKRLRERADVALETQGAAAEEAEGESIAAAHPVAASAGPVEAALHEVRKAARRLRHAAEAVTPEDGGGKKYRRLAAAAKEVEKSLGVHRDGVMFGEYLSDMAARAHAVGEATFVYGVLAGRAAGGSNDSVGTVSDLREAIEHVVGLGRKL